MVSGEIWKRSKYLKKWELRYTAISPEGLFSFKSPNDSKHSYSINASTVQYLWTRFDFQDKMMVIKIMHGSH